MTILNISTHLPAVDQRISTPSTLVTHEKHQSYPSKQYRVQKQVNLSCTFPSSSKKVHHPRNKTTGALYTAAPEKRERRGRKQKRHLPASWQHSGTPTARSQRFPEGCSPRRAPAPSYLPCPCPCRPAFREQIPLR